MSFDYKTINLNAMIGPADKCNHEDCKKLHAMRKDILSRIVSGKIKNIIVNGKKFKLEESDK